MAFHDQDPDLWRAVSDWQQIKSESNPLLDAGARRNAMRHAEFAGVRLLQALWESGNLRPGQDPVEAFNDLLGFTPEGLTEVADYEDDQ